MDQNEQDNIRARIERDLIYDIIRSPIIKVGWWLLISFMVLGLAVWGIGTWSNKANISSLKQETEETLKHISNTKKEIDSLEEKTRTLFNTKVGEIGQLALAVEKKASSVTREMEHSRKTVELTYDGVGKEILEKLRKSLEDEIKTTKEKRELIETESEELLEDIRKRNKEIQMEIEEMNSEVIAALNSFTTLDKNAMNAFFTSLVGASFLALLLITLIALLMAIISLIKVAKIKQE